MSSSLRPHESQHTRPPCLSPTPEVYWNSHPSSRWCHPAISSSVVPFSSCPQSLPASGSFPMSQLFASGGQSTGVSASASVLPMNESYLSTKPSSWEIVLVEVLPSFQEDFLLSLWPPPCRCDNNYIAGSKESISLTLPSGHYPAFCGNSLCGSIENIPQDIKTGLWLSHSPCTLYFCFRPFLVPLVSRGQSCKEFILKSRLGF